MRQGSFADNFNYQANGTKKTAFVQINLGMTHLIAIEDGALSGNESLAKVALYDNANTSNALRKIGENVFDDTKITKIIIPAARATTIDGLCTINTI